MNYRKEKNVTHVERVEQLDVECFTLFTYDALLYIGATLTVSHV